MGSGEATTLVLKSFLELQGLEFKSFSSSNLKINPSIPINLTHSIHSTHKIYELVT